jgi:hypothetical protein
MAKTNHQFFSSTVAKLKIGNRTLDALTNQPSARHTIDAEMFLLHINGALDHPLG